MAARVTLDPARLWAQGWRWRGRTTRGQYALYLLCAVAVFALAYWVIDTGRMTPGWRAGLIVGLSVMVVPFFGLAVRRLSDMGWSGWWAWLLLVPGVSLLFHLVLIAWPGAEIPREGRAGLRRAGLVLACGLALVLMSRLFWTPYVIPAGSMIPTLLPGDYIAATPAPSRPARGDVVIFRHPLNGADYVKRILGVPGDRVQMRGGVVYLNGAALPQEPLPDFVQPYVPQGPTGALPRCVNRPEGEGAACIKQRFRETLPGGRSHEIARLGRGMFDDTSEFAVPEGFYFVLGDNRDNSIDSRMPILRGGIGLVPEAAITAQARLILVSSSDGRPSTLWTWRPDRIMKTVR